MARCESTVTRHRLAPQAWGADVGASLPTSLSRPLVGTRQAANPPSLQHWIRLGSLGLPHTLRSS